MLARALDLGGTERQMTGLAKGLDPSRWDVRVGCFRPEGMRGDELRACGIPVVRFPVRSFLSIEALRGAWQLASYIRRERIDIVHAFDYPMSVFAIPVSRLLTAAVTLGSQRSHRDLTPRHYRALLHWSDRLAHGVVVNSRFVMNHMLTESSLREAALDLCPNGLDASAFHPDGSRAANEPFLIGTVCSLRPEKGLLTLLNAFAKIRALRPGMKLAVVGSGPMLPALEARAQETGIADACIFEPATVRVPEWLRSFDIFVLPSDTEAFSNSLTEAMACGVPSIASNVGGNPELITPGETGLLFEAGDSGDLSGKLRQLIESDNLRRQLGRSGRERVCRNFSMFRAAEQLGSIYTRRLTEVCPRTHASASAF